MKLAYLILAHGHFDHLEKIVSSLASEEVSFFIHIDLRTDIDPEEFRRRFHPDADVHLVRERWKINWGGFNIVRATLSLLNEATRHDRYDYYSLISGQDFPVKSRQQIHSFLKQNREKEFVDHFAIPDYLRNWDPNGGQDRYNYFWLVDDLGPGLTGLFVAAQKKENLKRTFPAGLQPYGGSQWFTITHNCAEYICEYYNRYPDVVIFFRLVFVPDEMFIPTILLNSRFRNKIVNNNLRYLDWSKGESHPKILTMDDYANIKKSDCYFARKFDYSVDSQIVLELERSLV